MHLLHDIMVKSLACINSLVWHYRSSYNVMIVRLVLNSYAKVMQYCKTINTKG
jgi:hypothetical protein